MTDELGEIKDLVDELMEVVAIQLPDLPSSKQEHEPEKQLVDLLEGITQKVTESETQISMNVQITPFLKTEFTYQGSENGMEAFEKTIGRVTIKLFIAAVFLVALIAALAWYGVDLEWLKQPESDE